MFAQSAMLFARLAKRHPHPQHRAFGFSKDFAIRSSNTNTNYNSDAEREAGVHGMRAIASYLADQLAEVQDEGSASNERLVASMPAPIAARAGGVLTIAR